MMHKFGEFLFIMVIGGLYASGWWLYLLFPKADPLILPLIFSSIGIIGWGFVSYFND